MGVVYMCSGCPKIWARGMFSAVKTHTHTHTHTLLHVVIVQFLSLFLLLLLKRYNGCTICHSLVVTKRAGIAAPLPGLVRKRVRMCHNNKTF